MPLFDYTNQETKKSLSEKEEIRSSRQRRREGMGGKMRREFKFSPVRLPTDGFTADAAASAGTINVLSLGASAAKTAKEVITASLLVSLVPEMR